VRGGGFVLGQERTIWGNLVSLSLSALATDAMTEDTRYVLHRRIEVDPRELDAPSGALVEVVLRWGAQVLLVRYLRANERFVVSADPEDRAADVFVDRRVLFGDEPASSNSWVCIRSASGAWWVCPPPASGLDSYALESRSTLALGALELVARNVTAARAVARRGKVDRAMMGAFVGASIAVGTLGASALAEANLWDDPHFLPLLLERGTSDRDLWISRMVARMDPEQRARSADARSEHDNEPAPRAANERESPPRRPAQRAANGRDQPRVLGRQAIAQRGIFAALGSFSASSHRTAFDSLQAPTDSVLGSAGRSSATATVADALDFSGLGDGIASHGVGEGDGPDGDIRLGTRVFSCWGVPLGAGRLATAAGAGWRLRERATEGPMVRTARGPSVCGGPPGAAATCAPSDDRLYPADAIRRVVQRNIGQVQRCFEQALARRSTTEGGVEVRFVIGPNGAVMGAVVASNDTGDALLGQCATDAFRRWSFPPPPSVVTVSYPLAMRVE